MSIKKIDPETLIQKGKDMENLLLLDVRPRESYHTYKIDLKEVEQKQIAKEQIFRLEESNGEAIVSSLKGKEVVVVCTRGIAATKCAEILVEKGCDVQILEGGITAWKRYKEEMEN